MNLYNKTAGLDLQIKNFKTETQEKQVSKHFTRRTTIVKLSGKGETGKGEDVIWEAEKHKYPKLNLKGSYSFQEFSEKLDETQIFPDEVEHTETDEKYRRWALESAALDLALKQNKLSLAEALDKEYSPVSFVVSPSMNSPDIEKLEQLIEVNPGIEFKLDASEDWSQEFMEQLADMDRVRAVDLKGHYEDENVKMQPNPKIYKLVAERLDALIEDPLYTDETQKVLKGFENRVTWDKTITSVQTVKELSFKPDYLNIKPSRFGKIQKLLDTIQHCQTKNIKMYGGGQFELGIGRSHIHALASIFYPNGPNDVAPRIYNQEEVPDNPPKSPLKPEENLKGLEWNYKQD